MTERPYRIDTETGRLYLRESVRLPTVAVPHQNRQYFHESLRDHAMPDVIYPMFHALRAERTTLNRTWYREAALRGSARTQTGIYSMLRPYPIPYINEHLSGGMFSSEIYGRVVNAFMVDNALNGAKAAAMIIAVAHPTAIEGILSGMWRTVSMGSRTEEAYCGMCGADLIKEPCEHNPYDDSEFYVEIAERGFKFGEASNVKVPADQGAILQAENVDPDAYKLFASNMERESVYDVLDPLRTNLLEHASAELQPFVASIYASGQWLLDEFASARRRHFVMAESARHQEENRMAKITKAGLVAPTAMREMDDAAFGVIYIDETTQKRIRRFPITPNMTEAQRESLLALVDAAKDLSPEQQALLTARVTDGKEMAPIEIPITADSYTHLFDVIDEHAATISAVMTEAPIEAPAEPIVPPAAEPAPEAPAAPVITEAELKTANDALAAAQTAYTTLETAYAQLLATVVARQQLALGERVAHGHTLDTLSAFYQQQPLEAVQMQYALLAPTFGDMTIQASAIETVPNPIGTALESVTIPAAAPADEPAPVSTAVTEATTSSVEELETYFLGMHGAQEAAQALAHKRLSL